MMPSIRRGIAVLCCAAPGLASMTGCTHLPEEQRAARERQQAFEQQLESERLMAELHSSRLSFVLIFPAPDVSGWHVHVDGQDLGPLEDLAGIGLYVPVLPGDRLVEIVDPHGVVLRERVSLAEGRLRRIEVRQSTARREVNDTDALVRRPPVGSDG